MTSLLVCIGLALAARPRVAVVQSDDLAPYTEPVPAFTEALGEPVTVINLHGREIEAQAMGRRLSQEEPEVVFALGAKAAWAVRQQLPDTPLVYASVGDPERYGIEGSQVTGIAFRVPPVTTLSQFQGFFEGVDRIGVLRGSGAAALSTRELEAAADKVGIEVVIKEVDSPRRVRRAFLDLADEVEALWLQPDRTFLTQTSFRTVVEETRRRRLPLMVETDNMVRAGGLFAVVPSTDGVGRQAADIVKQVLDGASPGVIPVQDPEEVSVALNLTTLELASIPIDELLLDFVDIRVE